MSGADHGRTPAIDNGMAGRAKSAAGSNRESSRKLRARPTAPRQMHSRDRAGDVQQDVGRRRKPAVAVHLRQFCEYGQQACPEDTSQVDSREARRPFAEEISKRHVQQDVPNDVSHRELRRRRERNPDDLGPVRVGSKCGPGDDRRDNHTDPEDQIPANCRTGSVWCAGDVCSPARIFTGRLFSRRGIGHVVCGSNVQGGLYASAGRTVHLCLWRRANAVAARYPGLDPGDVYHALRCLEHSPEARLRRGLSRGRLRAHAR